MQNVNTDLSLSLIRLEEPETKEKKETFNKVADKELEDFNTEKLGTITVPKDSYQVLGDNRPNSLDSRKLGFIKTKNIIGRTKFTIFPFSIFGNKK